MLCNVQSKLLTKEQTDKVLKCHHEDPLPPSFLFLHGMLSEQLQRHIWIWASAANVRSKCGFVPCCLGSSVVFERLWSQLLDLSRCWVRSMRPDMYKTWYKTTWYFGMVNFIDFKTFQKWNDFGSRSHASKRYWITYICVECWLIEKTDLRALLDSWNEVLQPCDPCRPVSWEDLTLACRVLVHVSQFPQIQMEVTWQTSDR